MRSTSIALFACVAAVVVAGCNGSGSQDRDSAASTANADNGSTPAGNPLAKPAAQFDSRLYRAAERGHRSGVEEQLDAGSPVNAANPANGRTALHAAASNGHKKLVAFLLSRGADANAQDNEGNTPLHLAAMMGHEDSTAALVASTDKSRRNKLGKTAREVANPKVLIYFPEP